MAERNLSVRLAVIDGGKVKAELRDVGQAGERAFQRIEAATRPASRALQVVDGVAGDVRGALEAMAGRLGPVGTAFTRLGSAGLVAGAALAGVGLALSSGLREAAEAERSYRRLEAVLRATGQSSGLTARSIAAFAEGIERSTLTTAEAVQDAAAVLSTFRSVAGDTFTRALRLAQDLSAVFGQDLRSAATQLGKALEEPVEGISALRRVGVSFTASQRALIQSLVETGQTAEAQKVILDALEQQVGGAGAGEAGGLTGAANRLSDAWGNLLEAIGQTPAVSGLAEGALGLLADAAEGVTRFFQDDPIASRIATLNKQLVAAQDELARLEEGAAGGSRLVIDGQRRTVEALQRQVDGLIAEARAETNAFAAEQRKADAGRRAAEADRLSELLATQQREIDRAIDQAATDPGDRIARINRELEETRKRLKALSLPDGSNASAVDAALGRAEELARRRIEAIERPAREALLRDASANARLIEDLRRQISGLNDERQGAIDQALGRLSDGASRAQRAEVARLAGALFDEKEAREQLAQTLRAEERLREEGRRLVEATRTPMEEYVATLEHVGTLLKAGAIDQETFNRALAGASEGLAAAQARALDESLAWQDGVRRALEDYVDASRDAARASEEVTRAAFQSMEDALVSFVATGKIEFSSLTDSILADITRLAVRQAITVPLAGWLNNNSGDLLGGIGDIFAGIFHAGGIVDANPARTRGVDAGHFLHAPRYHAGGIAGLGPDEVPAILRRGEAVLTPGQMRALGADRPRPGSGVPPVNVVMNISTPDASGFRHAQGQIAAEAARAIDRARRNL